MSPAPALFTRIVLGLDQSGSDRATMRLAADFARLLRLDLFGLFAEDPSLARLGGLSSLREFRLLERQWRPIEERSLSAELERCAALARQSFDEIAQAMGVARRFEVVHARVMEAIASVSGESDIILLAEPRAAAPLARESFAEIVAAALATPAGVLVVPNAIVRARGPILAVAETEEDESVASAVAIAAAAHERVEVIAASGRDASTLSQRLGRPGERMIVMTRQVGARLAPLSLLAGRRVPVLVLGRARVTGNTPAEGPKAAPPER
jgi:hypothetical protein